MQIIFSIQKTNYIIQKYRCPENINYITPYSPIFHQNLIAFTREYSQKIIETNECRKKSHFLRYTSPLILYFAKDAATKMRPHRCDVLVDARRCREMRMWLDLRFSCARGGDEPGLDLVGMTRREERRMSRLSQASLFGFSPSRSADVLATRSELIAFPRIMAFISSLSLSSYFILLPRGVLWDPVVPRRGYILSSRNNKLTLLNLSWAAFKSSSLRQQRAPAYLPTNIVTAFNSVISTWCCTRLIILWHPHLYMCVCYVYIYPVLSLLPPSSFSSLSLSYFEVILATNC